MYKSYIKDDDDDDGGGCGGDDLYMCAYNMQVGMDKNIASLSVPLGQLKEEVLVSVCARRKGLMRAEAHCFT